MKKNVYLCCDFTDYDRLNDMTELETLITFEPLYKSAIWGGERIAAMKRLRASRSDVGESWEISAVPGFESKVASGPFKGLTITELIHRYGADLVGKAPYNLWGDTFPLLVKFIDAKSNLSIQVHPDDEMAMAMHRSHGKTEMWYVIDAAPGARIYSGLSRVTDPAEICRKAADGSVIDSLASFPVSRGDFFYIPAGTVHAIGAGVLVAEIQETSDISYRIFDFDRLGADGMRRPLHIEKACRAIDVKSGPRGPVAHPSKSAHSVVNCRFFCVDYLHHRDNVDLPVCYEAVPDSFTVLMAVHGDLSCFLAGSKYEIPTGSCALIPACVPSYSIISEQPFLRISLPSPQS